MNGIELAEKFYIEFGAPMIAEKFPEIEKDIAVALVGSGSECFGFDDNLSRDHDYEAGFCMFIPGEDVIDRRTCFLLERAYAALPDEFMGVKRPKMSPVGGNRRGVIRMDEFFMSKVGSPDGKLSENQWFSIPDNFLAEATNGKIFRDDRGQFSAVRQRLLDMPEDIRLKKLAGNIMLMAQSGQYNYKRCVMRGETGAAALACTEFVTACMKTVFLLNRRYMPYYKWSFRAMRGLPVLSSLADTLEFLISSGNSGEQAKMKAEIIEDVARMTADNLIKQSLTDNSGAELEKQAYAVNSRIESATLRSANIFYAV